MGSGYVVRARVWKYAWNTTCYEQGAGHHRTPMLFVLGRTALEVDPMLRSSNRGQHHGDESALHSRYNVTVIAKQQSNEKSRPKAACIDGADDGVRTRDPDLGKVVLYQLSHVRIYWRRRPDSNRG